MTTSCPLRLAESFSNCDLTQDQVQALAALKAFLVDSRARCFLLKGFAGTGKTFLIKGLAEHLARVNRCFMLMAPTGRAARVLQARTGHPASTIHRAIYAMDTLVEDPHQKDLFCAHYRLFEDAGEETDRVYIVDEASMVSDRESEGEFIRFGSGRLLSDLIRFSRVPAHGRPCLDVKAKIIFVGDPAQLPPVTDGDFSPALDADYLASTFGLEVREYELTETVRQLAGSGIARHATRIRDDLKDGRFNRLDVSAVEPDVRAATIEEVPSLCLEPESRQPRPDTICVAYKNRTVLDYNLMLRRERFGQEGKGPIQPGDRLIVVVNNAQYGLFNGDMAEVQEIKGESESRLVGIRGKLGESEQVSLDFREVVLGWTLENGQKISQTCMILENLLLSPMGNVTRQEQQALYVDFKNRHPDLKPNTDEFRMTLQMDRYFHALKVKYGYAITCHKAQGGEWDRVVVVFERPRGWANPEWFRWCYTAITRAKKELVTIHAPRFTVFSGLVEVGGKGEGGGGQGEREKRKKTHAKTRRRQEERWRVEGGGRMRKRVRIHAKTRRRQEERCPPRGSRGESSPPFGAGKVETEMSLFRPGWKGFGRSWRRLV